MLRRLSEIAPVLIVVEDVHWSDAATRETLGFLVRSLRADQILVAMTLRSDELHRRHPALPWLAELERTGRMQRIALARLSEDETAALLAAIEGLPTDPDAGRPDPSPLRRQPVLRRGAAARRGRAVGGWAALDAA